MYYKDLSNEFQNYKKKYGNNIRDKNNLHLSVVNLFCGSKAITLWNKHQDDFKTLQNTPTFTVVCSVTRATTFSD